jgi:hypothetical protein
VEYGDQKYRELVEFSASAGPWQAGLTALNPTCCGTLLHTNLFVGQCPHRERSKHNIMKREPNITS